jgi:hypothetical protein
LRLAPGSAKGLRAVVQRDPRAAERSRLRSEIAAAEAQLKSNAVAFGYVVFRAPLRRGTILAGA